MQKLYCYVDESGQDTEGKLFVVAVVIPTNEKEQLETLCLGIANDEHKRHKWSRTSDRTNYAYLKRVFEAENIPFCAYFARYQNTKEYFLLTINTIAQAIIATELAKSHRAVVLYDALPRTSEQGLGVKLRQVGIHVFKVKGVKDDHEPLICLADAICGLVRDADRHPTMDKLLKQAKSQRLIIDLIEK